MSIITLVGTNSEAFAEKNPDLFTELSNDVKSGAAFMIYSLRAIFKYFDFEKLEDGIVDSSYRKENHDYGIDAIYVTANNEIIDSPDELDDYNSDSKFAFHLLQFKKGKGVEQADLLKLKEGIEEIFINEKCDERKNEYLYNKMMAINEIKRELFKRFSSEQISVQFYIVFGGLKSTVEKDSIVFKQFGDIQSLLTDNGYQNNSFKIIDAQAILDCEKQTPEIVDILKYHKTFKYITQTGNDKKLSGYISIISAKEIAKLVKEYGTTLFESNIRDFYKKSELNNTIMKTSTNSEEAKYFWSFNNGITITCRKVEEQPHNGYKLYGIQIVNGCQTSNALYVAASNLERTNLLKSKEKFEGLTSKESEELKSIEGNVLNDETTVLTKIIETDDADLIYRITETTNSQTPIKAFSLKANENIQHTIEQYLWQYGIYYERRVNFYKNQGKKNIVSIQKLFQLYVAHILIMPSEIKTHPSQLFNSLYEKVFPDSSSNNLDYFLYLLPLLVDDKIQKFSRELTRSKNPKDNYNKGVFAYAKLHLGPMIIHSMAGAYSPRVLTAKQKELLKILNNETKFNVHLKNGLENLKTILKQLVGPRKDSIYPASRKSELDVLIKRFINQNLDSSSNRTN